MIGTLNTGELRAVPEIRWNGASEAEEKAMAIEAELIEAVESATLSAAGLAALRFPPRERVLGSWFKQGDLGFIFGPRGLGKTWLAMHLAEQIAGGGKVASWSAPVPRNVLYIDGEMPLDNLLERDRALSGGKGSKVMYLQHEALFHTRRKVLNLADPTHQKAISRLCDTKRVDVMFLDNLSCLFAGVKENDADDWERVLPWLLALRRNRLAVVFVAHAGRNGQMRGTSRREDAAFWILQLTRPDDAASDENGARFLCRFDKNRNATDIECPPIDWTFSRGSGGCTEVTWKPISALQKLRALIESGITSASNLAMEMKLSTSTVCRLAKEGMAQGWLRHKGREYEIVPERSATVFTKEEADEVLSGPGGL